jgi:hypothetical protein
MAGWVSVSRFEYEYRFAEYEYVYGFRVWPVHELVRVLEPAPARRVSSLKLTV